MLRYAINAIIVGVCTYLITYFGGEKKYYLLMIPIAVLIIQGFVNYWLSQHKYREIRQLFKILYEFLEFNEEQKVRITLLKPNKLTKNFVQKVRYSLTDPHLTNHKFHIHKGVAGQAYRQSAVVHKTIHGGFHREIMRELGFTEKEARKFIEKVEYFCVPIYDSKRKMAYVLCLDSEKADTFTEEIRNKIISNLKNFVPIILGEYDEAAIKAISEYNIWNL